MKRIILFILLAFTALSFSAGCGKISYEMTARNRAESYVKEKYGFSADITAVLLAETGWLEFTWEAPQFAHVRMKHDGTEFDVLVPVRSSDDSWLCDNYEADRICTEIREYVKDELKCSNAAFRIDYGSSYGNHLLQKDIRSADDLKKSENAKTISVFAYGLDAENVKKLDPAKYGNNTNFSIVEWGDEKLPEVPYGLIRGLPKQCGWNVSAVHYTENDGSWSHMKFDRITAGNLRLVMPSECAVSMEPAEGIGEPDDVPVSDWYCIKGTGTIEGYGAVYADIDTDPDEEYCIEYMHDGKAYYMRISHTEAKNAEYELYSQIYSGKDGIDFTFRVVKRDYLKSMSE